MNDHNRRYWLVDLTTLNVDPTLTARIREAQRIVLSQPDWLLNTFASRGVTAGDAIAFADARELRAGGEVVRADRAGVEFHLTAAGGQLTEDTFPSPPTGGLAEITDIAQYRAIWDATPTRPPVASVAPASVEIVPPPPAYDWSKHSLAQNLILFGPPGTGKTYAVRQKALVMCGESNVAASNVRAEFDRLRAAGQIEMVTFHPSFAYEEFVEGIRPRLAPTTGIDDTEVAPDDDLGEGGPSDEHDALDYAVVSGALKVIAKRATQAPLEPRSGIGRVVSFEEVWSALRAELKSKPEIVTPRYRLKNYLENIRVTPIKAGAREYIASHDNASILWEHRVEFGPGLSALRTTAIWKFFERHGHQGAMSPPAAVGVLRELVRIGEALGIDKQRLDLQDAPPPQYVLIIDEINRGNIAKILGELITLVEPSKRLGREEAVPIRLPYSQEPFILPPNLHIIGTMNTADRSIALMDVALRRRFEFEEMMPLDALVARNAPDEVRSLAQEVFAAMNRRIEFLYDREHQIGHAYFIDVMSFVELRDVFVRKVVPLLQEYFFDAWDKICLVLGSHDEQDNSPGSIKIVRPIALEGAVVLNWKQSEYENKTCYRLDPGFMAGVEGGLAAYFRSVLGRP
jgi:5-methylcytosine-specific restriction protein B